MMAAPRPRNAPHRLGAISSTDPVLDTDVADEGVRVRARTTEPSFSHSSSSSSPSSQSRSTARHEGNTTGVGVCVSLGLIPRPYVDTGLGANSRARIAGARRTADADEGAGKSRGAGGQAIFFILREEKGRGDGKGGWSLVLPRAEESSLCPRGLRLERERLRWTKERTRAVNPAPNEQSSSGVTTIGSESSEVSEVLASLAVHGVRGDCTASTGVMADVQEPRA